MSGDGSLGPPGDEAIAERTTPAIHEERKVVTVLFCDLVDFTARSDQADPEDVRAVLGPYHERLRTEIERFGGTVEKFIGDAVMAVFGAPAAHEDDPERAVHAGLRVLEAVTDLNDADPDLGLAVRIGIDTGEVLVSLGARPEQGEGIVTGDVVNTASRLQGVAPVGGVVVGEQTYRATERVFDFTALEPVALKGKASPVPIFRVNGARARFGVDLTRTHGTAMVGRADDLALLEATYRKALAERSVQLVTITGEPGIGKSRLVAELSSLIDARPELVTWRQGRCLPYGDGVTFWALGEIVKAQAGILETDPPDVAASKLEAVIDDAEADAPWLRQRLRPLVGLEAPQAAREENFAAWRAFLESLAEKDPTVLVFEDLHWADDALLAFLEHLGEYAERVPMLVVTTTRPELYERSPTWATSTRSATRVNLAPLSGDQTALLISNLLERAVLPAEVQRAILVRSEGNPLYAEEFVRLLKDREILRKRGSSWTLDPEAEIPVPSDVHGIIAARLDTLPPQRKRLLHDASVIGKVFWAGAVAAMGGRDAKEVEQGLHDLTRQELIHPARRSSVEGEREYAFSHALIRDVCYSQIPRASRAERHTKAAAWIEAVSDERVEDQAEILASHYLTSLELTRAARKPEDGQTRAKAIRYLMLAGDRANGMDVETAERHYAKALELTPPGHPERSDALARYAEVLLQRGRFAEAARAGEEAIEGFRAAGNVSAMARTMWHHGNALWHMGLPGDQEIDAEIVAMLEPLGPSPELAQAWTDSAGSAVVAGDYRRGLEFAERAMALAHELGLPEPARALGFWGVSRFALGDADGLEDMRHAIESATTEGLGREVALLHYNLGDCVGLIEGPRRALQSYRAGAAFAERRGIVEFALPLAAIVAATLVALGSWDEAAAMADRLAPRLEEAGDVFGLLILRSAQIKLHARRGDFAAATELAGWAKHNAGPISEVQMVALTFPAAAMARLGQGDSAGALALLDELERTLHVRGNENYAPSLPEAVRTALAAGDPDLGARLTHDLEPLYPLYECALTTARALLAEDRGDYAGAAEAFADAVGRWAWFEMPWERAHALLGLGRCLLALGRASEATEPLRDARVIFGGLRAAGALADADTLLARAITLTS